MLKPLVSATLAALSMFMLSVNESQACCFLDCFHCCKPAAPPPTYCPAPAPTCDVCPQQVNYVPQTCCSPISAPVTTYRPVATPLNYAPACSTCSGAAYSSPYYSGMPVTAAAPMMAPAPMPRPSCPTCGGGSAVSYTTPAMAPQPMYSTPGAIGTPSIGAPTLGAPPMGSPTPAMPGSTPSTFQGGATVPTPATSNYPTTPMTYPATPIPTTDPAVSGAASSATTTPRLLDPQNRTTSTGSMIGPATVTNAIFNTADRGKVFHPASQTSAPQANDNWSTSSNDGWGSK
jgi:hypothetical protein